MSDLREMAAAMRADGLERVAEEIEDTATELERLREQVRVAREAEGLVKRCDALREVVEASGAWEGAGNG